MTKLPAELEFKASDFKSYGVLFIERFAEQAPDSNTVPLTSEERLADFCNALLAQRLGELSAEVFISSRPCPTGGMEACWVDRPYEGCDARALLVCITKLGGEG